MAQKGRKMSKTFRGGVPYSVDVRRLLEAFPVPSLTEGRVIKHSQLEEIVNTPKGNQRYYSVINSWISQTRNTHGIFVVWEPTVGVKVLEPVEILTHAEQRTRQKIAQTGKAVRTFAWVDRSRLDAVGQQRLDHQNRVVSVMRDALQSARKDLAVNLAPIASLPKPKLIREA
jgi:hypothetical protein